MRENNDHSKFRRVGRAIANLEFDYTLNFSSPEFCNQLLVYPNLKLFTKLERKLRNENRTWISEFIQTGGLFSLLRCVEYLSCKKNENNLLKSILLCKCLNCIKEIMNHKFGMECIINMAVEEKSFNSILIKTILNQNQVVKKEIFQIFSAIGMYSEQGYSLCLEILNLLKIEKRTSNRFSIIVEEIKTNKNSTSYLVVLLGFINCLLSQPDELNERINLRTELAYLPFNELLEELRKNSDDDLLIQLNLYETYQREDESELFDKNGFDFNDPVSILKAICLKNQNSITKNLKILEILKILYQFSDEESNNRFIHTMDILIASLNEISLKKSIITIRSEKSTQTSTKNQELRNKKSLIDSNIKVPDYPAPPPPDSVPNVPPRKNIVFRKKTSSQMNQDIEWHSVNLEQKQKIDQTKIPPPPPLPTSSSGIPPPPPLPASSSGIPPPPPLPTSSSGIPPPPPLPASSSGIPTPPPLPTSSSGIPPPPPLPASSSGIPTPPPLPTSSSGIPPPPPLPASSSGIPPPPPLPASSSGIPPPPPLPTSSSTDIEKQNSSEIVPPPLNPQMTSTMSSSVNQNLSLKALYNTLPRANKALKNFSWQKLPPTTLNKENIWKEVNEKNFEFNFDVLEEFFAKTNQLFTKKLTENTDVSKINCKPLAKVLSSQNQQDQNVSFLDSKQNMNVNVYLRKIKVSLNEFVQLIINGNSQEIGIDNLTCLQKILPEKTDVENIQNFCETDSKNYDQLAKAEKFIKLLTDVPFYELRIDLMHYIEEFDEINSLLQNPLQIYSKVSNTILESKSLKQLITLILAAGNFLNSNSYNGQAVGFKINILPKLIDIKTNKASVSFLHIIVEEFDRKYPEQDGFVNDLKDISSIISSSLSNLSGTFKQLKKRTLDLQNELYQETTPNEIKTQFSEKIETYVKKVENLENQFKNIDRLKDKIIEYYCEDALTFNLDEFLSKFYQFCQNIIIVREDIKSKILNEEKIQRRKKELEEIEKRRSQKMTQRLNESMLDEDLDKNVMSNLLSNLKKGNMASVRKSVKIHQNYKLGIPTESENLEAVKANLRPNLRAKSNAMLIQFKREI